MCDLEEEKENEDDHGELIDGKNHQIGTKTKQIFFWAAFHSHGE